MMPKLQGVVEEVFCRKEGGKPYAFRIRCKNDQKAYFTHLGDLSENEQKLYIDKYCPTKFLEVGDEVEFDAFKPIDLLAIRVDKKELN